MKKKDTQNFEINQLLDAIFFRYGYDFRNYARASMERRIINRVKLAELDSVSEMIPKIMHDPGFFDLFLRDMSITVTEMFRDPHVYKKIRESVCVHLKTYPRINIWHAGCATGEEVYSMAILLEEEGLLKRTTIYATDFNNHSLKIAEKGIYPAEKVKLFTKNYISAGGKASFVKYYQAKYEHAKIKESLKKRITFANHNLIQDKVFTETHLILCRNVLIYFNKELQNRALNLFKDSLVHRGFFILGNRETIDFTNVESTFEKHSQKERIYRKRLNV
ncbi:MAG: protein-glutamate O-methyltransferase CheR [Candidatus Brocadiaceae bacterium]|nr:protein-glutamate O-methyltransferase CheR [Candidatus Brocadiaceae bacterium]